MREGLAACGAGGGVSGWHMHFYCGPEYVL